MNIVYFVTEDSYFLSHRLPVAINAQKLGHKVFIVTKLTGKESLIESYGFEIVPISFNRAGLNFIQDIIILFKLIITLRKISANIIHNVAIKPIIIGSIAAQFCKNIRVVNAFTGMGFLFTSKLSLKYSILSFFVKHIIKNVLKFKNIYSIVQNEGDMSFLKLNFNSDPNRIILIAGSGVDTKYFNSSLIKKNKESKKLRIVTTCRMLKDKGVLDLYEAALILKNRGVPCVCVFVGGLDSKNPSSIGELRLKRWIKEGVIEYHGQTSNILNILINADIYTLVSYREGLSKSILEAASVGLPIISTDIPASKDLVINNHNGYLVPVKNAFDLANAIEKLVLNHDLREKFGQSSRKIVRENFSEELVSKQTTDFYDTISN